MNHLYFPLYTKHLGQPLYKFGRKKLNFPKIGGIAMANIPGSIAHGIFMYINGMNLLDSFAGTSVSILVMTPYFYHLHSKNKKKRTKSRKIFNQNLERLLMD